LKVRVEKAADREHVSVNSWLVRAAADALETKTGTPRGAARSAADGGQRYSGWVR
jgi:hypothetical protein